MCAAGIWIPAKFAERKIGLVRKVALLMKRRSCLLHLIRLEIIYLI
jgi:hypothetical protein